MSLRLIIAVWLTLLAAPAKADPLSDAVEAATTPAARTEALVRRGEARRLSGRMSEALADLARAAELAPGPAARAFADAAYGVALAEAGRAGPAEARLRAALEAGDGQPALKAVAGAALARLVAGAKRVETSAMRDARFAEARDLMAAAMADARNAPPLIQAVAGAAAARLALGPGGEGAAAAQAMAARALAILTGVEGPSAAAARLSLGDAALAAGAPDLARRAYLGVAAADGRTGALATLGLAEAALAEGAFDQAEAGAVKAARLAAALAAEDVGFSADWLRAETLARAGRPAKASTAYETAFEGLRGFRARAPLGAPPVTDARRFAPRRFQLDYIDFLFATGASDAALTRARDLIEDLKLDEIDDYFAERCTPARGRVTPPEALGADVAVLYPVVFADRTEVIWTIGGRIGAYRVELGREDLRRDVTRLRYLIDLRVGGVEDAGGALYDRLIEPIAPELEAASIRTLVVAPDGPLRALPFAALWDGEGWLGARFGLATILGLGLVDQGAPRLAGASVLAAGAEAVGQGYPSLPSVPLELEAIRQTFGASVLAEDAFSAEALASEIAGRPFDIVHIATHAEFGASPTDNFIVTSDGKLDVTRLEATMRARAVRTSTPVELLTLSACNTAAELDGDAAERAPLGLAGVGFRAGARSVLASLWPAEDASTGRLMTLFYQGVRGGLGRAEALRAAQQALIEDPATAEPFQWANFLLIGDWR